MDLVIDIGNSNIVVALRKDKHWENIFRYETRDPQPGLFYENGIASLLFEWGTHANQISEITISSVVPELNEKITTAVFNATGIKPLLIRPQHLKMLDFPIPHVSEIGTDLVANAFGAISLLQSPCIITDFGTALTFTVAHPIRGIEGVTIAPGIKTAFTSLSGQTAQLPNVTMELPDSAIGKNTSHAIRAGILIGYEGLVSHLLTKIKEELPEKYLTIATGGVSEAIAFIPSIFDHTQKNLTIEGIRLMRKKINTASVC